MGQRELTARVHAGERFAAGELVARLAARLGGAPGNLAREPITLRLVGAPPCSNGASANCRDLKTFVQSFLLGAVAFARAVDVELDDDVAGRGLAASAERLDGGGSSWMSRCTKELHRVVEGAVGGATVVVDRHDVRMVEAGEEVDLLLEAGQACVAAIRGA